MLNLILTLAMTSTQPAVTTAQFKPCVWPNVCKTVTAPVQTAQFQPCVWPRYPRRLPPRSSRSKPPPRSRSSSPASGPAPARTRPKP